MKLFFLLLGCFFLSFSSPQSTTNVYLSRNVRSVIYSEAPLENIEAISTKGTAVLNISSGEVQFVIPISSFQFKKSLMQEHFNENYMESDKYSSAKFKGKINQSVDFNKDGDYPVTVSGELDVHGVKRQRNINGTIRIEDKKISVSTKFDVLVKDHKIKIPQLLYMNIAESIQVTVSGAFIPYTTPQP